ncbi:RagB/SusD family nutrient uptake outer membrane protein [Parapedobacter indicus]|uniref:SusD family protein n=1 Tax=Parapedobacter indicus TaxID=1477437 RepID=A0A1I3D596_9SPHI|nr:RagB/SusD family nutrient uptake outer membrane protein [Parapedobacter indicus]PPL04527.1 SusD-like starch-binding protein associating with outer membrane [Parapedobacter indicus]SFH81701.1 SusD family protein [Parapedobacter indicus]
MKKIIFRITGLLIWSVAMVSCSEFLEEKPKTFLSPSQYYTSENQIQAAVEGTYEGLSRLLGSDLEIATVRLFNLEYIVGNSYRPRSAGSQENQFLLLSGMDENNSILREMWRAVYFPVENCNSVIENVEATDIINDATKNRYLGQVYFLRAYYYFMGVQLFGDIPLKIEPTRDLADVHIPKTPKAEIYNQIVSDLQQAEASGLPWTDDGGYVNMGAVKTLLAKVYLTMAGYPLQAGNEYYQKAYETSKEVIESGQFRLFDNYQDLRAINNENRGEHIFMIQREAQNAGSPFHFGLMPYPEAPISVNPSFGGGMAPLKVFYDSYDDGDRRKAEQAFFYTKRPKSGDPSTTISLNTPYLNKYWDDEAEKTSKSGANIPIYRYADVLLLCAEAKALADGGTTSDAAAVDAYYAVNHRAFPAATRPSSVTADGVLKERFLELCFEFQNWYDMLRTHKTYDPASRSIVDLLGYKAPNHEFPFKESDLIFPVPLREKELNPLLEE